MTTPSFAALLNSVKTMLSGLKNNPAAVAKRGWDAHALAKMEKTLADICDLDNEQEALKAKLKTKTAQLNAEFASLQTQYADAKKVVKMSVDQAGWREYGIEDKR